MLTGMVAPATNGAQQAAGSLAAQGSGTVTGLITGATLPAMPAMPGMPALPAMGGIGGEGSSSADGSGSASLTGPVLAVAGTAAAAGQGAATVMPGMPVTTPDGAMLGKVREIVADGRGQVQQVVVQQGEVTRALPAGMFSASGNALIAGQAQGSAETGGPERTTAPGTEAE
jgi:sporulation protein YlmC with PRC-barrel domain